MRHLLLSIALLLLALPAAAADLLIVQSQRRPLYDQAVQRIRSNCGGSSKTVVMGDYSEFDLGRIAREEQPRLVVAIGEQAFTEARKLRRTPVVYALTLNVHETALGDNIHGVTMHVAPDNYLKLFKKLQLHRIGVLFDPEHSGAYLERVHKAAAGSGVELVTMKVTSPRDVPAALNRLTSLGVDTLWMIPDSTAVAPESVDAYFHAAQQHNLPIIGFAKGYLTKGALAVLEGSSSAITEQSCALIRNILNGVPSKKLSTVDIDEATLFTNENVATKLHLKLSGVERPPLAQRE